MSHTLLPWMLVISVVIVVLLAVWIGATIRTSAKQRRDLAANARLVRAAPKLLAALKAAVVELDSTINNPRTAWDLARAGEIIRMARATIARATKDTREGLDHAPRAS